MTQPWEDLVAAERAYYVARRRLFDAGAEEQYDLALRHADGRGAALRALRDAPVELVMALVQPLFEAAIVTSSDVGTAREVLARIDRGWLSSTLPSKVVDTLARPGLDEDDIRRLAELLDRLSLADLLEQVVAHADASEDPDVRDVGDDFRAG